MSDKEMEEMPIWQNHEQRITALEINMTGISEKMDRVEETIKEGNNEQKQMLQTINNRMVEEFFHKKKFNLSNTWKLIFMLLGAGGLVYLIIDKLL